MKSLTQLENTLQETEPLSGVEFKPDGSTEVTFNLPNGWNQDLTEKEGTFETAATVEMHGEIYSLTKDAALQATSLIGVTRQYAMRTPGSMMAEHLNYWMSHGSEKKSYKLLHANGKGLAFTKGKVVPVSNVQILHMAVEKLSQEFKVDEDQIVVDFKYHHDLRFTQYRLVVAEALDSIESTVRGEPDLWSYGVDVTNSLTAEAPLEIRGYLFNWWNHAGNTSTHATTGRYSRKGSPTEDGALEWLEESFSHVFADLAHEFVSVSKLPQIDVEGEITPALREIFEKYKVPAKPREDVINLIYSSEDLTMYGVLSAITEAANNPQLTHQDVNRLLQIGGDLPGQATGRCKACHRLPIG
jgi:hypothetical protein